MFNIHEHVIPREYIEIKINDKWINLQDYHDSIVVRPDWVKEIMNLVEA